MGFNGWRCFKANRSRGRTGFCLSTVDLTNGREHVLTRRVELQLKGQEVRSPLEVTCLF